MHLLAKLALVAATAADAGSSWHQPEANPLLAQHGHFGMRGVGIMVGVTSLQLGWQAWNESRHPERRKQDAWVNFGVAGAHGALAIRNVSVR